VADNSWSASGEEGANMSLTANYNNGINKHENIVSNMYIQSTEETQGESLSMFAPSLILVVVAGAGMLVYRKKKQRRK